MIRIMTVGLLALVLGAPVLGAQEQERPGGPKPSTAAAAAIVNLNTATMTQLESLPGIGTKVAERIVEYRQKNGGFKKVEDVMLVRGVGEKSFLKLKPLITVTAARSERAAQ